MIGALICSGYARGTNAATREQRIGRSGAAGHATSVDVSRGPRTIPFQVGAELPFIGDVSYAAVSSSTPSRLVRRRGSWALELIRLVALDNSVLEPRAQRLEGSDAILRHLRHSSDQSTLAHGAAQLMRALRGEEDKAFVVIDGEWVPSSGEASSRRDTEADLKAQLSDVRAEFLLLRASHQRLRDRVAALEARLQNLHVEEQSARPAPPEIRERQLVVAKTSVAQVLAEAVSPVQAENLTKQSAGIAPEPPPPVNPFSDVAQALGREDGPVDAMTLPDAAAALAAIGELFGGDSGLASSDEEVPDSALELAALYAGRFVDDDGKDVGVLLAELKLVAHIGGKLMGLPSTVIEEQGRTGILNDQVLLAMSEVVNTLSNTVNQLPGNPHVRSTPVEPFPADRLEWLANARQRVSLGKNRIGTLWLVAR